jgi:predicted Zn-dependent protease
MDDAMRKAARDFGASIALDSKPFLSYFHTMDIGRQYVSVEDSRRLFDQAAKLDPNSFGLRTKYMLALEPRWGGTTQAMRDFLEECKKTKLSVANLHELESMVYQEEGNEYRIGGNLPAAEAAYRKALALGPCSCGNVNNDLNNLLFETHQYAAAIPLLDEYLKQKPGDLWALANRGSANMNANRPREAIEDWRQAAEAGDSFSQCHLGMAYLTGNHDFKPNYQKSVYWLRKAAEQGEADAQANLPIAEQLAARNSAIQ